MKPTQTATLKLKPNRYWKSTPPATAPGTASIISVGVGEVVVRDVEQHEDDRR